MHQLARRHGRVGVFRPVVRAGAERRRAAARSSCRRRAADAARRGGRGASPTTSCTSTPSEPSATIVDRYHDVARPARHRPRRRHRLHRASRHPPSSRPTRAIAANLGTPMLLVVPARDRTPRDVAASAAVSVAAARHEHAHVAGVVANQVPEGAGVDVTAALRERLGAVPAWALHRVGAPARPHGPRPRRRLRRPPRPRRPRAARPRVPRARRRGDVDAARHRPARRGRRRHRRPATATTSSSACCWPTSPAPCRACPASSSTAGFALSPQVDRLVAGLGIRLPVVASDGGTMATATALGSVEGRLTPASERKIRAAVAMVDEAGDLGAVVGDGQRHGGGRRHAADVRARPRRAGPRRPGLTSCSRRGPRSGSSSPPTRCSPGGSPG